MPNAEIETFRVRLTFIGEQMSGKTTVVKLLSNLPHIFEQDRTDGLEISCVSLHDDGWKEVKVNNNEEELFDALSSCSLNSQNQQSDSSSNDSFSKSLQDIQHAPTKIVANEDDLTRMTSTLAKCSSQTQNAKKKRIYFWGMIFQNIKLL
jgi:hypothetical protein